MWSAGSNPLGVNAVIFLAMERPGSPSGLKLYSTSLPAPEGGESAGPRGAGAALAEFEIVEHSQLQRGGCVSANAERSRNRVKRQSLFMQAVARGQIKRNDSGNRVAVIVRGDEGGGGGSGEPLVNSFDSAVSQPQGRALLEERSSAPVNTGDGKSGKIAEDHAFPGSKKPAAQPFSKPNRDDAENIPDLRDVFLENGQSYTPAGEQSVSAGAALQALSLLQLGDLSRAVDRQKRLYALSVLRNVSVRQRISEAGMIPGCLQQLYAVSLDPSQTTCSLAHLGLLNLRTGLMQNDAPIVQAALDVLLASYVGDEGYVSEKLALSTLALRLGAVGGAAGAGGENSGIPVGDSQTEEKRALCEPPFPLSEGHHNLVALGVLGHLDAILEASARYPRGAVEKALLLAERFLLGFDRSELRWRYRREDTAEEGAEERSPRKGSVPDGAGASGQHAASETVILQLEGLQRHLEAILEEEIDSFIAEDRFPSLAGRVALRVLAFLPHSARANHRSFFQAVVDLCVRVSEMEADAADRAGSASGAASVMNENSQSDQTAPQELSVPAYVPSERDELSRYRAELGSLLRITTVYTLSQGLGTAELQDYLSVLSVLSRCSLCDTALSEAIASCLSITSQRLVVHPSLLSADFLTTVRRGRPFLALALWQAREAVEDEATRRRLEGRLSPAELAQTLSPLSGSSDLRLSTMSERATAELEQLGVSLLCLTEEGCQCAELMTAVSMTGVDEIINVERVGASWLSFLTSRSRRGQAAPPLKYRFIFLSSLAQRLPPRQALELGLFPKEAVARAALEAAGAPLAVQKEVLRDGAAAALQSIGQSPDPALAALWAVTHISAIARSSEVLECMLQSSVGMSLILMREAASAGDEAKYSYSLGVLLSALGCDGGRWINTLVQEEALADVAVSSRQVGSAAGGAVSSGVDSVPLYIIDANMIAYTCSGDVLTLDRIINTVLPRFESVKETKTWLSFTRRILVLLLSPVLCPNVELRKAAWVYLGGHYVDFGEVEEVLGSIVAPSGQSNVEIPIQEASLFYAGLLAETDIDVLRTASGVYLGGPVAKLRALVFKAYSSREIRARVASLLRKGCTSSEIPVSLSVTLAELGRDPSEDLLDIISGRA